MSLNVPACLSHIVFADSGVFSPTHGPPPLCLVIFVNPYVLPLGSWEFQGFSWKRIGRCFNEQPGHHPQVSRGSSRVPSPSYLSPLPTPRLPFSTTWLSVLRQGCHRCLSSRGPHFPLVSSQLQDRRVPSLASPLSLLCDGVYACVRACVCVRVCACAGLWVSAFRDFLHFL